MLKTSTPEFVGLKNYKNALFGDFGFYNSLKITIIFLLIVVPLEFLIGLGLASILNNIKLKIMRVIGTILLSPLVIAPVAIGTIWKLIYQSDAGFINEILRLILPNVNPPIWLANPRFALIAVMIVDIWEFTPFFMLLILGGLKSMPTEPFESAKVDGASSWQCFKYLTINFLKPVILIGFVFRTVDAFREFDKAYILTKGGPAGQTEFLSIFIYRIAFVNHQIGYAASLSIIMLIMSGFITWSFIKAIKINL